MQSLMSIQEQYRKYLIQQYQQKEQIPLRYNSIYEFRVLQCFDSEYTQELQSMLQYIKSNKYCKTIGDCRKRVSNEICVQMLDTSKILDSSAIMVDTEFISRIQTWCNIYQLSCIKWDLKAFKMLEVGEFIKQLNSVDIVIIDSKDYSKMGYILENEYSKQENKIEQSALEELFEMLRTEEYLQQDVSTILQKLGQDLQFQIRNNGKTKLDDYSYTWQVTGYSFQRFIMVPGLKKIKCPVFSKCSWLFSALKLDQDIEYHINNSFLKKFQNQGLLFDFNKIRVNGSSFQFEQLINKENMNIKISSQLYYKKITLQELKQKTTQQLKFYFQNNSFRALPFKIIQNDLKQLEMTLQNAQILKEQMQIPQTPNLMKIVQGNLNENCFICMNEDKSNKFVFGCCGCVISVNCMIDLIISLSGIIKCPNCRLVFEGEMTRFGVFFTYPQFEDLRNYFQDFQQCVQEFKQKGTDLYIQKHDDQNSSNWNKTLLFRDEIEPNSKNMQIMICMDNIPMPNILSTQKRQEYYIYNINKTIHVLVYNKSYETVQIVLLSSKQFMYTEIQQLMLNYSQYQKIQIA